MSWEVTLVMVCLSWICCFYIFLPCCFFSLLPWTKPPGWLQPQVFACKSGVKMNGAWENVMILPKALVGFGKRRWLEKVRGELAAMWFGVTYSYWNRKIDRGSIYIYMIYLIYFNIYIYIHSHTVNGCKWYMILIIHELWCDYSRYILFSGRHFHKMLRKFETRPVWEAKRQAVHMQPYETSILWVYKCCNVNTLCLVFCFGGSTTELDITTINNIQTPPTWSEQTACCWWVSGIFRMYQTLFCVRDTTGPELRILTAGKFKR